MKTTLIMLMAMMISVAGMAQKSELKAADKALKSGDAASAKTTLEGIADMIGGADAKVQGQYYYTLGRAYSDLAMAGSTADYANAITAFNKVLDMEAAGKSKYSADIQTRMQSMAGELVNAAVEDGNNSNYKSGAEKLYMSYQMRPQDTTTLYYAASYAVTAKDYEVALDYYKQLKDLGYTGSTMTYKATNIETGKVESFGADQFQRDLLIKGKTHNNPVDEKSDSKRSEIVKNIALIYNTLGQNDMAKQAYKDARAEDPNDVNIVLNEANLWIVNAAGDIKYPLVDFDAGSISQPRWSPG